MKRRVRGFAAALALVFASSAAGLLAGSATAAAAEPIVIGDCSTTVQGTPGQPVSLSPGAVLSPVTAALPLIGNAFAALPPIPIGALPTGTGYITGATIANAVVAQVRTLPGLGGLVGGLLTTVLGNLQATLTSMCGVTVTGVNAVAAPVQDAAEAVADAAREVAGGLIPGGTPGPGTGLPGTPGGGGGGGGGAPAGGGPTGPGVTNPTLPNQPVLGGIPGSELDKFLWSARSPMSLYGSIPFARPGLFAPSPGVRYGGSVSGYTPQFGILGNDQDGVQAAGHAEGLTMPAGNKIALPVLLAVFALAGVTAALVRTWVLRQASAA